jgi:CRP-like cAMP-binding protein
MSEQRPVTLPPGPPPPGQRLWLLRRFNAFEEVPTAAPVLASAGVLEERRFDRGARIESAADQICFVTAGRVRIDRHRRGDLVAHSVLVPGQVFGFGELAGASDDGAVEAAAPTTILRGEMADIVRALGPGLQESFALALVTHLCQLERRLELIHQQRVPMRVAGALLELAGEAERASGVQLVDATHTDVARLVGTTRESVSRVIAFLKHEGVITGHGALRVADPERLRALAGEGIPELG